MNTTQSSFDLRRAVSTVSEAYDAGVPANRRRSGRRGVETMTKQEALKEARIAVALKGGTYYVTRKGTEYGIVYFAEHITRKHGKVAEIVGPSPVRVDA